MTTPLQIAEWVILPKVTHHRAEEQPTFASCFVNLAAVAK